MSIWRTTTYIEQTKKTTVQSDADTLHRVTKDCELKIETLKKENDQKIFEKNI